MNKWLRRALLGGVAMTVMAAGAQADELSALKAQLESLQARVATMEARAAAIPEGASLITFERGTTGLLNDELFAEKALDAMPNSRGVSIAITPTADLPAPVASIELGGYIRAVGLWHSTATNTKADLKDFDIWARGHVNMAMTTDTAVGRVTGGIQVRGDMGSNALGGRVSTYTPEARMRTAWARWQMTDALSLTFGQTGQIAALSNVAYNTVAVPVGLDSSRRPQFRLTYNAGPVDFRFGIEDPSRAGGAAGTRYTAMPDFAGSMGFNMGSIGFRAGGEVGKVRNNANVNKTGWIANAGINMNLGSMVAFNFGGAYTKGLACDGLMSAGTGRGLSGVGTLNCLGGATGNTLIKAWALQGNMAFNMTETVAMVLSGGYLKTKRDTGTAVRKAWSVDGALVWKPVDALQFGIEGDYFYYKDYNGNKYKAAAVGFAGWYFF